MNRKVSLTSNQNKDYVLQNKQKFQSKRSDRPKHNSGFTEATSETLNKDIKDVSQDKIISQKVTKIEKK